MKATAIFDPKKRGKAFMKRFVAQAGFATTIFVALMLLLRSDWTPPMDDLEIYLFVISFSIIYFGYSYWKWRQKPALLYMYAISISRRHTPFVFKFFILPLEIILMFTIFILSIFVIPKGIDAFFDKGESRQAIGVASTIIFMDLLLIVVPMQLKAHSRGQHLGSGYRLQSKRRELEDG